MKAKPIRTLGIIFILAGLGSWDGLISLVGVMILSLYYAGEHA